MGMDSARPAAVPLVPVLGVCAADAAESPGWAHGSAGEARKFRGHKGFCHDAPTRAADRRARVTEIRLAT
jgi:hypothetical protein